MAVIPFGFAQATMIYTSASLPHGAANTLGFDVQAYGGSPGSAAQDVYERWAGVVQGLAGTIRLAEVLVKFGPGDTGPAASFSGETVSAANAPSPPNVAYLVRKNTNIGGRQGRGRMYLPGVNESAVDAAGGIAGTLIADLSGRLGTAFAGFIADNLPPVLLHEDALAPTPLINLDISGQVATMRRRLRR